METATAIAAISAVACRWREDHQRGVGGRLQHAERIHRNVPESPWDDTAALLRNWSNAYESLKSIITGAERNQFVLYPT